MFLYHLRLAGLSLKQQPMLTALMIGAIGIGVGACMTVLTVLYALSSDPIPEKSHQLFAVRLDSWSPEEAFDENNLDEPSWQLTFKDAIALMRSPVPVRQAAMHVAVFTAVPENTQVAPFLTTARMTGGDFFEMFDVPFLYGGGWDAAVDQNPRNVVVLSRETNETLFGGENSVGREVRFGDAQFVVSGVTDTWSPSVRYYDVNTGAVQPVEDVFMPFSISASREVNLSGNIRCWEEKPLHTYQDLLQSECVVIQYWAELADDVQRAAYQSWLNDYTAEQKKLGRFQRPVNNRLDALNDWLELRQVVSNQEWVLMSIAVLFLIACLMNTVGLILAWFIAKSPTIGLRRALGASRWAIFQQHLVEVGVVGLAGGLVGMFLAYLGLVGLRGLISETEQTAHLNVELLATTIVIAIASAVCAGLYPTWRVCRLAPANYLKTQ